MDLDVEGIVRASDTIMSTKPAGAPFSIASTDVSTNLNADMLDGFQASAFSQFGVSVDTGELADDAVTAEKVAAGAIGSSELANDSVTAGAIQSYAVGNSTSSILGTNAVTTTHVLDGAITLPKLDASGGAFGQVLGHDGVGTTWSSLPSTSWTPISSLPYTVSTPGRYFLTGSLTGVSGQGGIVINASDVILDLNGFALIGVSGSGYGIRSTSSSYDRVVVRNGTVRNWGLYGVSLAGNASLVSDLRSSQNTGGGISVGGGSLVVRCLANVNGGGYGFYLSSGASIIDCVADHNASGIGTLTAVLVRDCVASWNDSDGIRVGSSSQVIGNHCHGNGFGPLGGVGINIPSSNSRVEGNSVSVNATGIKVLSYGNLVIRNSAHSNTTNYDIAGATNAVGPLVTPATIASNTNPHANYDL